jgi:hypothetical protein
MELVLFETAFLKNSKTALESFKKIGIKNLDVDHYEIYKCAKNKFETLRLLASVKKTNQPKIQNLNLYTVHYTQIHAFVIFTETKIQ